MILVHGQANKNAQFVPALQRKDRLLGEMTCSILTLRVKMQWEIHKSKSLDRCW